MSCLQGLGLAATATGGNEVQRAGVIDIDRTIGDTAHVARFERTFTMEEAPAEAEARLLEELGDTLYRIGFKLKVREPSHLLLVARFIGPRVVYLNGFGPLWILWWLWRKAMKHRIEAAFVPYDGGSTVTLSGRSARGIAEMVTSLGESGHWPDTLEDRDWVPIEAQDPYEEWDADDIDVPDVGEMDKITRRALKKAGRLP